MNLKKDLWHGYEKILYQEEFFWYQKSRCQWLNFGHWNTRFFHTSTIVRRRRNKTEALKNDEGLWIYEAECLKSTIQDFFKSIYSKSSGTLDPFPKIPGFPSLSMQDIMEFQVPISEDEIRQVFFSIGAFKHPCSFLSDLLEYYC